MIIVISILIFAGIVGILFFLVKLFKEEKKYAEEDKKAQDFEIKKNQTTTTNEKIPNILKEEELEKILSNIKNNPNELEDLKEKIQEKLRNCIRAKDMDGARKCNLQLKKINLLEKEGN